MQRSQRVGVQLSKSEFDELQAALAHERSDAGAMAQALLQRHHDPLSACLVQGLMLLAQGKARESHAAFLQASQIAPGEARAYLGLAQALFQLGHADRAIAASQHAFSLDQGLWQALLVIADAQAAIGQWDRAAALYRHIMGMGVSDILVHLGLGTALVKTGKLAEAREQFAQAVAIAPGRAAGYCNLGYVEMLTGRYAEAIALFRQALPLTREVPDLIHTNLAHACYALGDYAGAEAQSARALALSPDLAIAHGVRADTLRKLGRHREAITHYRRHGTPDSAAKALEDLYHLGDMDAFAAAQAKLAAAQPDNRRLAAISALAATRHGARFASGFCADPVAAVAVRDVTDLLGPFAAFRAALLQEAQDLDTVWEPPAKTTKGGYQTEGNLFALRTPMVARLDGVIRTAIADYFAARAGSADRYVRHAPKDFTLSGWTVRLRQGGRQAPHIHPDGWVSGVLYLTLPRRDGDEGAIAFPLGEHYFTGGPVTPQKVHRPREGELVLFPSSLFHYTVPFKADEERVSLAFDMVPAQG